MPETKDIDFTTFPCEGSCAHLQFQVSIEGWDEDKVRRQCEDNRARMSQDPAYQMLSRDAIMSVCGVRPVGPSPEEGVQNA
jgi:hypothetical protein